MAAGRSTSCTTVCFVVVVSGRSISSMTLAERRWPSKSTRVCRPNGSSACWIGSWPGAAIRANCGWTMGRNLSPPRWPIRLKRIPSNWNLSNPVSRHRIPISNDLTAPIAIKYSTCMSLRPYRKYKRSQKNGWINTTKSDRMMRSETSRPSNFDGLIKRRKTLI